MALNLLRSTSKLKPTYIKCTSRLSFKLCDGRRYLSDESKKEKNLYETLGLPSSATHVEIKKAYFDLTFKYHPDRNENSEEAALKFREVTEAYEILGNYGLRKRYDGGIPVSDMRKVIKHEVDHKAKYQEFFDSRIAKRESDTRWKELEDLSAFTKKKKDDYYSYIDKFEEDHKDNTVIQGITVLFFSIIMYYNHG